MAIIADAGPPIHLSLVGALDWAVPDEEVEVASSVWEEIERHAPAALQDSRFRRVPDPAAVPDELGRWRLHRGERFALAHALSRLGSGPLLVLCDEKEARRACTSLGLARVGSIGLVLNAFTGGRVEREEAERALRELPGRGRLHVTPAVLEAAIAELSRDRS